MSKISSVLQNNFADLQSEFSKLLFLINKNNKNYNNYDKSIIELNDNIKELELKILEIKQQIFSKNNKKKYSKEELDDIDKDNLVIEIFKPLMLKYRMML